MIPRTPAERLAVVRRRLEADVDRREKSIGKAEEKLSEAVEALAEFDAAVAGLAQQRATDTKSPCVVVLWPNDPEPHVTEIGENTTYLELVADYVTFSGYTGDLADFIVSGEEDGRERNLHERVSRRDHGLRLCILAAEEEVA
jgi:hypothetical protein